MFHFLIWFAACLCELTFCRSFDFCDCYVCISGEGVLCPLALEWILSEPIHVCSLADLDHQLTSILIFQLRIFQFSCSVVSDSLRPHGLRHTRPPCPSPTHRVYSNSCPLSWWCHPTISSSVVPFFSCLQSFPASGSFQMSSALRIRWPKYWSFSFSISPSNEYSGLISFRVDWFDLLAVQGLSRVFSNTTVQKHQFFSTQLSL